MLIKLNSKTFITICKNQKDTSVQPTYTYMQDLLDAKRRFDKLSYLSIEELVKHASNETEAMGIKQRHWKSLDIAQRDIEIMQKQMDIAQRDVEIKQKDLLLVQANKEIEMIQRKKELMMELHQCNLVINCGHAEDGKECPASHSSPSIQANDSNKFNKVEVSPRESSTTPLSNNLKHNNNKPAATPPGANLLVVVGHQRSSLFQQVTLVGRQIVSWSFGQILGLVLSLMIIMCITSSALIYYNNLTSTIVLSFIMSSAAVFGNLFLYEYAYPKSVTKSNKWKLFLAWSVAFILNFVSSCFFLVANRRNNEEGGSSQRPISIHSLEVPYHVVSLISVWGESLFFGSKDCIKRRGTKSF
jgi:hypothetical protein